MTKVWNERHVKCEGIIDAVFEVHAGIEARPGAQLAGVIGINFTIGHGVGVKEQANWGRNVADACEFPALVYDSEHFGVYFLPVAQFTNASNAPCEVDVPHLFSFLRKAKCAIGYFELGNPTLFGSGGVALPNRVPDYIFTEGGNLRVVLHP